MSTAHDPVKAAAEVLTGMIEAHKVIVYRTRDAERRASETEAELNALLKLDAWSKDAIAQQQAKLNMLRAEAEARAKT